MGSIYDSRQRFKLIFIFAAILIAIASVVVSDMLIKNLAQEERQKIEVWAEATRVVTSENPSLNMTLILRIIQGNTSIPVILCNDRDSVIANKNIDLPEKDVDAFLKKKVNEFKSKNQPIPVDLENGSYQYLYYDDSIILKRLLIYPYAQLSVVFVFILIAFLALASTKRAEQNKVWVGLSKETAHQLGTPISSLIAWVEYLRTKDIDPSLLNEMEKDVKRLETIAERFSKIGSNPDPIPVDINNSIRSALSYMETRISSKVKIYTHLLDKPLLVLMNDSLFAWVIENLIKNAVDAMEGHGEITFQVEEKDKGVRIDIADTGKGIPKSKFKTVFNPGYTTKKRGWGLGLSLVKRIIESYHGGKIFVKSSELGKGTTFRIELRKYKG
ncbi:sensor histidine kinase [Parabacteroides bouchesdurhonensis]|uniref:sensor histidine kinase n=1 Tax=Parabacteroides bouchesdurhonensis TaxID=1936995 RepID=UPI000E508F0D|nr:HAMP domain-containing sensor histidine kinase [Parabacteroides bouchesdurhonensis]RHJ90168.1 sensor histidine kinase [Bacteroides sp. AM07-16]